MKVLLDTHAFLWWITDSDELSERAREVMADRQNQLFFSAASGWEIAIKVRLGKLKVAEDVRSFIPEQLRFNNITPIPISLDHALHVTTLVDYHRDPFDRLLIAQSQVEQLPLLTADPQISRYPVETIW